MSRNNVLRSDMSRVKTIVVCGMSGSGKSQFINTVTGAKLRVGHDVDSETINVTEVGIPLVRVDDDYVQLVDTPGFDDNRDLTEQPVLQRIIEWLCDRYRANARIHGLIYLRPIYNKRISRTEEKLIKMFKELCGENCLDRVIIVNSQCRDDPEDQQGYQITLNSVATSEKGFGSSGAKKVQVCRLNNGYTRDEGLQITRYFWDLSPVTLQVQREVVDEGKTAANTTAGETVGGSLSKDIEQLKNDIKELERALAQQAEMNQPVKKGFWAGLGAFLVGTVVSVATLNPGPVIIGALSAVGLSQHNW